MMDHPLTLALCEVLEASRDLPHSEWAISLMLSTRETWCVRVYGGGRYSLECLRSIPSTSDMTFKDTIAAYVTHSTQEHHLVSAYLTARHTGYNELKAFDEWTAKLFYTLNDMRLQAPFVLQHKKKVKSP